MHDHVEEFSDVVVEVPMGFEPMNAGFANRSVKPLRHGTIIILKSTMLFGYHTLIFFWYPKLVYDS